MIAMNPDPHVAAFIESIKATLATLPRGETTQLAAYLGTTRQQLNDWLTKRKEPSGRYVLAMQRWQRSKKPKN